MCGSSARTDLYGGQLAIAVPTVTGPMGAQFANPPQLTTVRAGRKYLGVGCGCSLGSVEFARGQADQFGRYVFVAVRAVH